MTDALSPLNLTGWKQVKDILEDCNFRLLNFKERGTQYPSFFLAFDMLDPAEHSKVRSALTRGLSGARLTRLEQELCHKYEGRKANNGAEESDVIALIRDIVFDCVGIPKEEAVEILATYTVSQRYLKNEGDQSPEGRYALQLALEGMSEVLGDRPRFSSSFIRFLDEDGTYTEEQKLYLVVPFFDMLAAEKTFELPLALSKALSNRIRQTPIVSSEGFSNQRNFDEYFHECARLMEGIQVQRTPSCPHLTSEVNPPSPVIHLDISQANHDESIFAQAQQFCPHRENVRQHLSFGKGEHACLGQPLVYTICKVMAYTLELLPCPIWQRAMQVNQ